MNQIELLDKFKSELGVAIETIFLDDQINILSIEGKNINRLPDSIGELSSIEILFLKDNKLVELPASIRNLRNLKRIVLTNNRLESLPDMSNFINLEELHIEYNELTELPASICKLTSLKVLKFNNNMITSLPADIGNLVNINTLEGENNGLKEIPEGVVNIANLEFLKLNNNKIKSIPAEFHKLKKLQIIQLKNNRIRELPDKLDRFEELREFDLSDNLELDGFNHHYLGKLKVAEFAREYIKIRFSEGMHICPECSLMLPTGIIKCTDCEFTMQHCHICQWGFEEEAVKLTCPICSANYHKDHLLPTYVFGQKCPACKTKVKMDEFITS